MAEYSIYIDDSGDPKGLPYLVLAGYIASDSQWLAFGPAWTRSLAKYGFNSLRMDEFMRVKMNAIRRDRILAELAAVVNSHTEACIVSALDLGAYKKVNNFHPLEIMHGLPHTLALRRMMDKIFEWQQMRGHSDDHHKVVVAQGARYDNRIAEMLSKDEPPSQERVLGLTPALQAANMLAWESLKAFASGSLNTKTLRRLGRNLWTFNILNEADLLRLCRPSRG